MADAHSPGTITVVPLRQLPHPSTLATSSSFLVHQAQKTFNELSTLRQNIATESSTYILDPPERSSLPPLPPIPVPPSTGHRKPSSFVTPSLSSLPTTRPSIPPSSPLYGTRDLRSCCEALRTLGHRAEERYKSTAVWVVVGSISAWILLRIDAQPNAVPSVRCIRLLESSKGDQPIHAQSTSAPHRALSKHLTDLCLPLPELLFRLVSLPELLKQPCHFCQKHLRVPDGLPYGQTGYLPTASSVEAKDATKMDTDQDDHVQEEGKWVSWHPSCQPLA